MLPWQSKTTVMKKALNTLQYGIYINRRKAVLVSLDGNRELSTADFSSPVTTLHFAGESSSKTGLFGHTLNRQQQQQRKKEEDLKKWCKSLVARMKNAGQVFIFGPSDTKYLLQHEVERRKTMQHVYMEMETTDNLTRNQVIRLVKKHFKVAA